MRWGVQGAFFDFGASAFIAQKMDDQMLQILLNFVHFWVGNFDDVPGMLTGYALACNFQTSTKGIKIQIGAVDRFS